MHPRVITLTTTRMDAYRLFEQEADKVRYRGDREIPETDRLLFEAIAWWLNAKEAWATVDTTIELVSRHDPIRFDNRWMIATINGGEDAWRTAIRRCHLASEWMRIQAGWGTGRPDALRLAYDVAQHRARLMLDIAQWLFDRAAWIGFGQARWLKSMEENQ